MEAHSRKESHEEFGKAVITRFIEFCWLLVSLYNICIHELRPTALELILTRVVNPKEASKLAIGYYASEYRLFCSISRMLPNWIDRLILLELVCFRS